MNNTGGKTQGLKTRDGFDLRFEIERLLGEAETGITRRAVVGRRIQRLITEAIRDATGEPASIWHDLKARDLAYGLDLNDFDRVWPTIESRIRS